MTQYRAEYDDQMKTQLGNFEIILNSYQRRADLAALTSATAVGASIAPRISNSRNVSTSTTTTTPAAPSIPSATGLVGSSGLVANANSLIGAESSLLMPSNLTSLALANKGAAQGLGIEPTVLLDERSRFINHLQQLRRINVGDDRSDMPGYGLYLVRMPVSVLPGAQSIKGKGAMVTVEAKHNLTSDLLPNTFRNAVILGTAYQLMDAVTRGQYLRLDDTNYECCSDALGSDPNALNPCMPQAPARDSILKPAPGQAPAAIGQRTYGVQAQDAAPGALIAHGGSTQAVQGSGPGSEVIPLYGANNLRRLVCAIRQDQLAWYRHDPSVVSWLLTS
jgi:hypothetical protein